MTSLSCACVSLVHLIRWVDATICLRAARSNKALCWTPGRSVLERCLCPNRVAALVFQASKLTRSSVDGSLALVAGSGTA